MSKHPEVLSEYLKTIDRLEPDITPIDASAYYASAAISLKRIADALEQQHSVARLLLRADTEITTLADRLWRVHPKEIQDLGITRQQYYEREIRTVFENLLSSHDGGTS